MTSPGWRMQFLSSISSHQHSLKWHGIDKWLYSEKWHCKVAPWGLMLTPPQWNSSSDCSVHNWEKSVVIVWLLSNLPVILRTNFVIFHSRYMTSPTEIKGKTQEKNNGSAEADLIWSGEFAWHAVEVDKVFTQANIRHLIQVSKKLRAFRCLQQ